MSRVKMISLWSWPRSTCSRREHFREPEFYLPIMPPYMPWHAALVFLSGVDEGLIGVGL